MDTIFLRDLRIRTIVGIWEWERRLPQVVSIDLDMATEVSLRLRTMDEQGIDIEALSINPNWYKADRDLAKQIISIQKLDVTPLRNTAAKIRGGRLSTVFANKDPYAIIRKLLSDH